MCRRGGGFGVCGCGCVRDIVNVSCVDDDAAWRGR